MKMNVLRVFVDEKGKFGNPVGIVLDEKHNISQADRQTVAQRSGFSETVFINDLETFNVSIFNPQREVLFAGHALVGTSYFLSEIIGKPISSLLCKTGKISTWQEDNLTWVRASLENTPPWHHEQLVDVSLVENLSTLPKEHTVVWAWIDKNKGAIRARTFAPDWGIPEDEANGSGSMQLAKIVGQSVEIHHGKGSIIYAKLANNGFADVGGRIAKSNSSEIII